MIHSPGCQDDDLDWNDTEITCVSNTSSPTKQDSVSDETTESATDDTKGAEPSPGIGGITFVKCVTGSESPPAADGEIQAGTSLVCTPVHLVTP